MKLLLTGGCGFIGAAAVRHLMRSTDHVVINADKLTYGASEDALEDARGHNRHVLVRADVSSAVEDRKRAHCRRSRVSRLAAGGNQGGAAEDDRVLARHREVAC